MKNIQIPEGGPEVLLHGKLPAQLSEFVFNAEQYAAGLAHLGIPDKVVDGLQITFRKEGGNKVHTSYRLMSNRLDVGVASNRDVPLPTLTGSWQQITPDLGAHVNYALAASARRMADHVLSHDDALLLNRDWEREHSNGLILGRILTVAGGVIVGGQVYPAELYVGHSLGLAAGMMLAAVPDVVWPLATRSGRQENAAILRASDRIQERGIRFADSEEARALFNGVVRIEFEQ